VRSGDADADDALPPAAPEIPTDSPSVELERDAAAEAAAMGGEAADQQTAGSTVLPEALERRAREYASTIQPRKRFSIHAIVVKQPAALCVWMRGCAVN
jgi:hypothetical protein